MILPQHRLISLVAVTLAAAATAARAQVVFTEVMHSPGGNDSLWEWVEIRNVTSSPVDLDGWVFDDDDDAHFAAANITSAGGTRNTIVPAGGVAVLYPGGPLNYESERFEDAWGAGITLVAIDNFTALTATDVIGLWPSHASYLTDAIPDVTTSPRRTFAHAAAVLDYSSDFPASGNGRSIAWNGSGSVTSGANWAASEDGMMGAFTSVQTTIESAQINSTDDRGNPGILPPRPAAPGLLITEIMFAPDSPLVTVGFSSQDFEWIEVFNNTATQIDFAATPYVFDDIAGAQLTATNVNAGTIAAGGIGILFNNARITIDDMQAMWGDGNYIPVERWPALNNAGGDTIALWASLNDYNNEPVIGTGRTHDNAVAAVTYNTVAGDGWPTVNTGNSIWLNNLASDPDVGEHWTRANAVADSISRNALPIYQTAIDHPGGDVGSPGYAPGGVMSLAGDHNQDGKVDAADYVLWRTSDGSPGGYNAWRGNFGVAAFGGGNVGSRSAVPEPAGAAGALLAAAFVAVIHSRSSPARRSPLRSAAQ
jgi:hypothetical protein